MKVLYITPVGQKVDPADSSQTATAHRFDFEPIRASISQGMRATFKDLQLSDLADLHHEVGTITSDVLRSYDLILCDLTTGNPNVLYLAGCVETLGTPIIYFMSNESNYPAVLAHKQILLYSGQSITNEFQKELHDLVAGARDDPSSLLEPSRKRRPKVFISYSHQDRIYLDRLLQHLKPLTRKGLLDVWVDTKIKTGDKWQETIQAALENASIAILLISADFMASDFIVDNELPPLLSRAEVKGTEVLPVVVSPCRFARDPVLSRFQSANPPHQPLSSMSHDEREAVYDRLMADIEKTTESV